MQSKWAKKTAQRIASGELAESIIRKARALLRDAVNAEEYFKREPSPSATAAEAWELVEMISTHAPRVTDAQAREEWEGAKSKMRARLREMIANRAPLELRAALVASVYGEPGRAADESED